MQIVQISKPVMSSREIADRAGKRHQDTMRAIRNMESAWEKVNGCKFALVEYKDGKGEMRPEYLLTKTETLYVATKFNDEARARLVLRWEELETQSRPENTFEQLLQQASVELQLKIEERDKLNAEIVKYNQVLGSITTSNTTLNQHYRASTLRFLDKYIPLWKLRGYIPVNDFRATYNTEVPYNERLGLKELFQAVEDYCSANQLIFKKSTQQRVGQVTQRVHKFIPIN